MRNEKLEGRIKVKCINILEVGREEYPDIKKVKGMMTLFV